MLRIWHETDHYPGACFLNPGPLDLHYPKLPGVNFAEEHAVDQPVPCAEVFRRIIKRKMRFRSQKFGPRREDDHAVPLAQYLAQVLVWSSIIFLLLSIRGRPP